MYIKKSIGETGEPCGIPVSIDLSSLPWLSITSCIFHQGKVDVWGKQQKLYPTNRDHASTSRKFASRSAIFSLILWGSSHLASFHDMPPFRRISTYNAISLRFSLTISTYDYCYGGGSISTHLWVAEVRPWIKGENYIDSVLSMITKMQSTVGRGFD